MKPLETPKPAAPVSNVDYLNFPREEVEAAVAEDGGMPEDVVDLGEEVHVPLVDGRGAHLRGKRGRGRPKLPMKEFVPSPQNRHLFNEQDWKGPIERYKTEKYEHRIIAYLKAQGYNNIEIAERTGYSYGSVCAITKLPWVKEVVLETIREKGEAGVQDVLRSSALDSVLFLVETRDNDKAQTRDRISAADKLLDRFYGKPNQPITHKEEVDLSKLSDTDLAEIALKGTRVN
jgi:hypothetical protein